MIQFIVPTELLLQVCTTPLPPLSCICLYTDVCPLRVNKFIVPTELLLQD